MKERNMSEPQAQYSRRKQRARDLGIPFEGTPGQLNAITDVKGIEVGHVTLISGQGELRVGVGPIRTGVTAIWPRGKQSSDPVFAGWFALNGNGEITGTTWVEESGFLEGPITITNTHSVGIVRDAVVAYRVRHGQQNQPFSLPVVAETWDGYLNDANGFHVKERHVFEALESARSGPVEEGNVGGGTGMICHEFKGGIGTASRKIALQLSSLTVGVLVQANYGRRDQLRIAGVPVGLEIPEDRVWTEETGSIIVIAATDAPGDIFIAFSTANPEAARPGGIAQLTMLSNDLMDPLFEATVQATEEAIINAMIAAETMTGADNHRVVAIPHDRLREALKKYNRLTAPKTQEYVT